MLQYFLFAIGVFSNSFLYERKSRIFFQANGEVIFPIRSEIRGFVSVLKKGSSSVPPNHQETLSASSFHLSSQSPACDSSFGGVDDDSPLNRLEQKAAARDTPFGRHLRHLLSNSVPWVNSGLNLAQWLHDLRSELF